MKNKIILVSLSVACFLAGASVSYGLTSSKLAHKYDFISKEDPISAYFWHNLTFNVPTGPVYDRQVRIGATVAEGVYSQMFVGDQVQEKVMNIELRNILEEASKNKAVFLKKMNDIAEKYPELQ